MSEADVASSRWWLAWSSGLLAWLSMASGIITLFVAVVVTAYRVAIQKPDRRRSIAAITAVALLLVAAVALTPRVAEHDDLRAKTPLDVLRALLCLLAHPETAATWSLFTPWRAAIVNLPLAWWCIRVCRPPSLPAGRDLFLVVMAAWFYGQCLALAVGRGMQPFESRYCDILVVGTLLNLAALLGLFTTLPAWPVGWRAGIVVGWLACVGYGISVSAPERADMLAVCRIGGIEWERRLRFYLTTRDTRAFAITHPGQLPYPSAEKLRSFLDDAVIRGYLPAGLTARDGR